MREAAADELIAATDVADLLVRLDVPFREAHGIVAGLVRTALDGGKALSELSDAELAEHSDVIATNAAQFREVLRQDSWLESKVSEGGTSSGRLAEQLLAARELLEESPASSAEGTAPASS
jgi:argininosuccinate lyase